LAGFFLKTQRPRIKPCPKDEYLWNLVGYSLPEDGIDILCSRDNIFIDPFCRSSHEKEPSGEWYTEQLPQKAGQKGQGNPVVAFVITVFLKG